MKPTLRDSFVPQTCRWSRRIVVAGVALEALLLFLIFAAPTDVPRFETWSCHEWLHDVAWRIARLIGGG